MVSILDRTLIIDLCIRFIHNYYWFKRGNLFVYLLGGIAKRPQRNKQPTHAGHIYKYAYTASMNV